MTDQRNRQLSELSLGVPDKQYSTTRDLWKASQWLPAGSQPGAVAVSGSEVKRQLMYALWLSSDRRRNV